MHYGITTRCKVLVTVSNVLKLRNYEKTGFLLPGIPLKLENDVCPVCMYWIVPLPYKPYHSSWSTRRIGASSLLQQNRLYTLEWRGIHHKGKFKLEFSGGCSALSGFLELRSMNLTPRLHNLFIYFIMWPPLYLSSVCKALRASVLMPSYSVTCLGLCPCRVFLSVYISIFLPLPSKVFLSGDELASGSASANSSVSQKTERRPCYRQSKDYATNRAI